MGFWQKKAPNLGLFGGIAQRLSEHFSRGKFIKYDKINGYMEAKTNKKISAPPRLIPAFIEGFNSVTKHIALIIPPILLDLILWFAPRIGVKAIFEPFFNEFANLIVQMGTPDVQALLENSQALWSESLERLNLLSAIRTFPIGVPSLLAGRGVQTNPLGESILIELPSFTVLIVIIFIFVLLGIAAGSIFFGEIARVSLEIGNRFTLRRFFSHFRQTVYLTLGTYLLLIILTIPVSILLSLISLINPVFTQIGIIFLSLILIWLLLPLVFSPHGIYSNQQNVFNAVITSIRLVRYFLPGTGIFLLIAVLISQGLDILWTFPPEDSWMTIIGIFGHSFVVTGLITSSFIYYRGGIQWMNERLQRLSSSKIERADQNKVDGTA